MAKRRVDGHQDSGPGSHVLHKFSRLATLIAGGGFTRGLDSIVFHPGCPSLLALPHPAAVTPDLNRTCHKMPCAPDLLGSLLSPAGTAPSTPDTTMPSFSPRIAGTVTATPGTPTLRGFPPQGLRKGALAACLRPLHRPLEENAGSTGLARRHEHATGTERP